MAAAFIQMARRGDIFCIGPDLATPVRAHGLLRPYCHQNRLGNKAMDLDLTKAYKEEPWIPLRLYFSVLFLLGFFFSFSLMHNMEFI